MPVKMFQHNDFEILRTLRNQDGTPHDLSGQTLQFNIKKNITDPNPPLLTKNGGPNAIEIWASNPATPSIHDGLTVFIQEADTATLAGQYWYEIVELTSGQRITLDQDSIYIEPTVTT